MSKGGFFLDTRMIIRGDDFNNYQTDGYYQVSAEKITDIAHSPEGSYGYGILEVVSSKSFIVHRYTPDSGSLAVTVRTGYKQSIGNIRWNKWK